MTDGDDLVSRILGMLVRRLVRRLESFFEAPIMRQQINDGTKRYLADRDAERDAEIAELFAHRTLLEPQDDSLRRLLRPRAVPPRATRADAASTPSNAAPKRADAPTLVAIDALTSRHFDEHPVWAACASFDRTAPWYDSTLAASARPWTGSLPVDPADGRFLVRADVRCADGTRLAGFLSPMPSDLSAGDEKLGTILPDVFLPSGESVSFWLGRAAAPRDQLTSLYDRLGKTSLSVFPLRFSAPRELALGVAECVVDGFYTIEYGGRVRAWR